MLSTKTNNLETTPNILITPTKKGYQRELQIFDDMTESLHIAMKQAHADESSWLIHTQFRKDQIVERTVVNHLPTLNTKQQLYAVIFGGQLDPNADPADIRQLEQLNWLIISEDLPQHLGVGGYVSRVTHGDESEPHWYNTVYLCPEARDAFINCDNHLEARTLAERVYTKINILTGPFTFKNNCNDWIFTIENTHQFIYQNRLQ